MIIIGHLVGEPDYVMSYTKPNQTTVNHIANPLKKAHSSAFSFQKKRKQTPGIRGYRSKAPLTTSLSAAFLSCFTSSPAGAQEEATDEDVFELREFTVTATKREESQQDVPLTIQPIFSEDIARLRIKTLDDYMSSLTNVVSQGTGPGQNEIFIRGAATSQTIITLSSVQGLKPSVALYLDEQPVALQGRNLDVYAADLARIEVLPGPQGTLFGASSQAGTVRLITNKPNFSGLQAGLDATYSLTKGGDPSNSIQLFYNLPVSDKLAVRVALYNDRQGGWIDHILNDPANGGWNGSVEVINRISQQNIPAGTDFPIPRNDDLVEDNFNDAVYTGGRFSLAYRFSEDWELLLQHTEQTLDTEGVWAYDPNLDGESSVNRFAPDENSDEFGLTTWTLEGRLGMLDVVYTGGYLNRDVDSTIDYTFYTNGGLFSAYYVSNFPDYDTLYNPQKVYKEDTENTRNTHELRVTTPVENRFRALAGLFYDQQELASVGLFKIASTANPAFSNLARTLAAPPGTEGTNTDGGPFPPEFSFINDVTRTTDQLAAFGELEFDVSDDLSLSVGARTYEIEDAYKGATSTANVTGRLRAFGDGSLSALQDFFGNAAGQAYFDAIQSGQLEVKDLDNDGVLQADDIIMRLAVDWKIRENQLLYASYSEGFRAPVTNRVGGDLANNQSGAFDGFRIPVYSQTDSLDNYEIGFKGEFLDNRMRVNLSAFLSKIENLQTSRFDPTNINFLWFADNVGDAEIRGLEADLTWRATKNFIMTGSISYLDSEITRLNPELIGIAAPIGSELPFSPEFSATLQAQYEFDLPDIQGLKNLRGYVRGNATYASDSVSGLKMDAYVVEDTMQRVYQVPGSGLEIQREADNYLGAPAGTDLLDHAGVPGGRYVQDGYVLFDVAVGVTSPDWDIELFVDNIANESVERYIDTQQFTPHVVTNRPRTIGFRLSYRFY